MGRKKARPSRAGGPAPAAAAAAEPDPPSKSKRAAKGEARRDVLGEVDGDTSGRSADDRRDIAELVIRGARLDGEGQDGVDLAALEEAYSMPGSGRRSLRLRVRDAPEDGFRLGHWPVVPADCVLLEYHSDKFVAGSVFMSGRLDGPDEGVSGLVHLVSLGLMALRVELHSFFQTDDAVPSVALRVRVEVTDQAFAACESLLEVARHPWRKSLMNVMAWVRPEVTTSAMIYGMDGLVPPVDGGAGCDFTAKSDSQFDLAAFYEAVKPSTYAPCISCSHVLLLGNQINH
jgi:E3 ubiquitin-protein ligase SHPRH